MGLTKAAVGGAAIHEAAIGNRRDGGYTIALAGNPNVGKSSLFNALTGAKQHTGNWTGKTISLASGRVKNYPQRARGFRSKPEKKPERAGESAQTGLTLVDLPGAYSLRTNSPEEEVAREFILSGKADAVAVVCDACSLERNLILALQILELTPRVVLCVNLIDEAERRGIRVDLDSLERQLGVPVAATSASSGEGLEQLCEALIKVASKPHDCDCKPPFNYTREVEAEIKKHTDLGASRHEAIDRLIRADSEQIREKIISCTVIAAEGIAAEAVCTDGKSTASGSENRGGYRELDQRMDKLFMSKYFALPMMLILLALVFWLTIVGSNYPSRALEGLFLVIEERLFLLCEFLPLTFRDMLIHGMLGTLFRVVAVMLPPMAIFFVLFTLLEDCGLFARIAFNSDCAMKHCKSCGKQSLTMMMGLGCNAAGVVGARIIDSERERKIAILTNNFMPCNGRLPPINLCNFRSLRRATAFTFP